MSFTLSANVLDDLIIKKKPAINQTVIILITAGFNEQIINENSFLGEQICKDGDRNYTLCSGVSLGEGICLAGDRNYTLCSGASVGEGICLAGDRNYTLCSGANIAEGVCLAGNVSYSLCSGLRSVKNAIDKIPYKDRTFWWDRFRDQYGNYQWRCRGGQTKQFANDSKCSGVSKDDDRWPG